MDYETRIERFEAGDFPLVCVRSGRTDDVQLRPATALHARSSFWLEYLFWPFDLLLKPVLRRRNPAHTGYLPYARGERDVDVALEPGRGILIRGASSNFVNATRARQGRR